MPRFVQILFAPLLVTWLLTPGYAFAEVSVTGRVVAVHDGDTLTILDPAHKQIKIRLASIDAPEFGQPYGKRAKQELSRLAFGKTASVDVDGIDRYGRAIGRITIDKTDINAELVKQGAAWVYRKYSKDKFLLQLEQEAREARTGLWALPEAERVPPWEWRKIKLHARPTGARDR
jgi:endonuclease YncB( thermonuclease family)